MTLNLSKASLQQQQALDDAVYAYLDWRAECTAVWHAYRRWTTAAGTDAALTFGAYMAALDREETAANVYARLMSRVDDVEWV